MRDSFIFYNSFFESLRELAPDVRLSVYDAVANYALTGELQELTGVAKAIFLLIKPQIDANNKRYEDGCKGGEFGKAGGRPAKNKNAKNPSGVIEEQTQKTPVGLSTKTPNENDNGNDNDNENENVVVEEEKKEEEIVKIEKQKNLADYYGEYKNVHLTKKQYDTLYACILDRVILEKLINELSEAIARGKNNCKPFDKMNPDKHFADLKAFWRFYREHPEKFMRKVTDSGGKSDLDIVADFIKKRKENKKRSITNDS